MKFRKYIMNMIRTIYFVMIIGAVEIIFTGCATSNKSNDTAIHSSDWEKKMDEISGLWNATFDHVDKKQFGDSWNRQVEEFHKDNLNQKPGGVVMVGDSNVVLFIREQPFPGIHVINRGISGDRVIGVIARQNESIFELNPSKIFLLVGSNDAGGFPDMGMDELYAQYNYLFQNMKKRCPNCKIFIQSDLPIYGKYSFANPRILAINKIQKKLSKLYGFTYIDLFTSFSNAKGEMKKEYSEDGAHVNVAGHKVWRNLLEPYIKEK